MAEGWIFIYWKCAENKKEPKGSTRQIPAERSWRDAPRKKQSKRKDQKKVGREKREKKKERGGKQNKKKSIQKPGTGNRQEGWRAQGHALQLRVQEKALGWMFPSTGPSLSGHLREDREQDPQLHYVFLSLSLHPGCFPPPFLQTLHWL